MSVYSVVGICFLTCLVGFAFIYGLFQNTPPVTSPRSSFTKLSKNIKSPQSKESVPAIISSSSSVPNLSQGTVTNVKKPLLHSSQSENVPNILRSNEPNYPSGLQSSRLSTCNLIPCYLPGLQVTKKEEVLKVIFDCSAIDLDNKISHLDLIFSFCSFPIGELSLANLPISDIDVEIIIEIIQKSPSLSKLSLINCVFEMEQNAMDFHSKLPLLPLKYLELDNYSHFSELLDRIDRSIETLKLTNSPISCNFFQLTELLKKQTNLKSLTLDKNEIKPERFEVFFNFIFQLPKLTELSLINDGIFDLFIRLLSQNTPNSLLESLKLSPSTQHSNYCRIDNLIKLSILKNLYLPISYFEENSDFLSIYLQKQSCLKLIGALNYPTCSSNSQFQLPCLPNGIIIDLLQIPFINFYPNDLHLVCCSTKLIVDEFSEDEIIALLNSSSQLPKLAELQWRRNSNNFSVSFIRKAPNLKHLTLSGSSFNNFILNNSIAPISPAKLQSFEILCETIDPKNTKFIFNFLSVNVTIKRLKTMEIDLKEFSESMKENLNIEEWSAHASKEKDVSFISNCLTFMPKLVKLNVCFWTDEFSNELLVNTPIIETVTRIEELVIGKFYVENTIPNTIVTMFWRLPILKKLSVKFLNKKELEMIIDSLKLFPNLRCLKIISCSIEPKIIENLFSKLKSLNYLTELEIKPLKNEHQFYYPLRNLNLPFLRKNNLNYQENDHEK